MPLDENGKPIVSTPGSDEELLGGKGTDPNGDPNDEDDDENDEDEGGKNKTPKTFTEEEVAEQVKAIEDKIKRKHKRELEAARQAEKDKDLTDMERLEKELKELRGAEAKRAREKDVRELFEADNIPASSAIIDVLIREDETDTMDATETLLDFIKNDRRLQKEANSTRKAPPNGASKRKKTMTMGERIALKNKK